MKRDMAELMLILGIIFFSLAMMPTQRDASDHQAPTTDKKVTIAPKDFDFTVGGKKASTALELQLPRKEVDEDLRNRTKLILDRLIILDEDLKEIPIGGNVRYHPKVKVKPITTDIGATTPSVPKPPKGMIEADGPK